MTTGLHTVSDIYCTACNQIIGWKYEQAYEKSQKYKVRGAGRGTRMRMRAPGRRAESDAKRAD